MVTKQYNVLETCKCKSCSNYIHVPTSQIYMCTSDVISYYKYKYMYIIMLVILEYSNMCTSDAICYYNYRFMYIILLE